MHTPDDYNTDAYPAAIDDLGEVLGRALYAPSLGQGNETDILREIFRHINKVLEINDPASLDLFLHHNLDD